MISVLLQNLQHMPFTSYRDEPGNMVTTLSDQINISTRQAHTKLNRVILARLPLSLPPYTDNPSIYVYGLLHVTSIYSTFEQVWRSILADSHFQLDFRIHSLLSNIDLHRLERTPRLKSDIQACSKEAPHVVEANLQQVAGTGKVAEFVAHIRQSVHTNPHVLVAYAWVLYMALFSGGRFLRTTLRAAGSEFWTGHTTGSIDPLLKRGSRSVHKNFMTERDVLERPDIKMTRNEPDMSQYKQLECLSFFHFDGDKDGEDIKIAFKRRMLEAEFLLTAKEKDDVVQEGQVIFNYMVKIVEELDELFGTAILPVGKVVKLHKAIEDQVSHRKDAIMLASQLKTLKACSTTLQDLGKSQKMTPVHQHDLQASVKQHFHSMTTIRTRPELDLDTAENAQFDTKITNWPYRLLTGNFYIQRSIVYASGSIVLSFLLFFLGLYYPDFVSAFAKIPMF